jgi:hypothetical protein
VLVSLRLDRLSRSVADFCGLLDRASRRSWTLVVLNVNVDTSTPSGGLLASVMICFAEYERKLIGQRTSEALQVKKAAGATLGRPIVVTTDVAARIMASHRAGESFSSIARSLNADAIPTAHGGAKWHPGTVSRVVRRSVCRMNDDRPELTITEAAAATGRNPHTIRRRRKAGYFPNAHQVGPKAEWHTPIADLLAAGLVLTPTVEGPEVPVDNARRMEELDALRAERGEWRLRAEVAEAVATERERTNEALRGHLRALTIGTEPGTTSTTPAPTPNG